MDKLVLFDISTRNKILNKRSGKSKFGQHIQILTGISNIYEQLITLDVTHVILGVPEHISVFKKNNKTSDIKAWEATLKVLLNIENNQFTKANKILILGHLDFSDEQLIISKLNTSKKKDLIKAKEIVTIIDEYVTHLIHQIVLAGKKPIIIGGGYNNAYGNVKGASLALGHPINVINFNSHSGFEEEGRQNENAFSYAYTEGFISNYFVFGLHENDNSKKVFSTFEKLKPIAYNTFDALEIRKELKFKKELDRALNHISESNFGMEINCNAIENISSNNMTPSGFSVNKTRQFINYFAKHKHATYLHICEASPTKKTATQVGKLITYLITDFTKATNG